MSHRIAVMEAGHIVETGTAEQAFEAPRHPYTPRLLAAVLRLPVFTLDEPGPGETARQAAATHE